MPAEELVEQIREWCEKQHDGTSWDNGKAYAAKIVLTMIKNHDELEKSRPRRKTFGECYQESVDSQNRLTKGLQDLAAREARGEPVIPFRPMTIQFLNDNED